MPIVVSDTSPIRALHHLGLLGVLGQLFDRVIVPPAVRDELEQPRARFEPVDVIQFTFVEVLAPHDTAQVQQYREVLDAGESEALVVALELGADALLIDESTGRSIAVEKGMPVIGTLGILSRAKTRGYVSTIAPLLDQLRIELDFYVSEKLQVAKLDSVAETVSQDMSVDSESTALHESVPVLLLILANGLYVLVAYFAQSAMIGSVFGRQRLMFSISTLWYPASLLVLAQAVAALQLCWLRFQRRSQITSWKMRGLSPRIFFESWGLMAILLVIGIPTLNAFAFIAWLGPFNLRALHGF